MVENRDYTLIIDKSGSMSTLINPARKPVGKLPKNPPSPWLESARNSIPTASLSIFFPDVSDAMIMLLPIR